MTNRQQRVVRRMSRGDKLQRREARKPKRRLIDLPSVEEQDQSDQADVEGMGGRDGQ